MEFDLTKPYCFYFNELSKIPRGSRNEKAVSDYIVSFAKEQGLPYIQDAVYNVIIDKPGTPGYGDAPCVIMQAHLDMVCEKNNDSDHDFTKDPLDLYVDEEGWLHARGTTLGADDGMGVAYMMAILASRDIPHPPVSCVFTTMEEIGLLGASAITKDMVHGKRMINLDGGGETATTVSSAGGASAYMHCPLKFEENTKPAYVLKVRGLLGGHSGAEIHKERGNANKIAARILKEAQLNGLDITLVSFSGGLKYNAIPREADVCFVSSAAKEELEKSLAASAEKIKAELEFSDAGFKAVLETAEASQAIAKEISDRFLNFVFLMPDGFRHKSMAIEGLTAASLNCGVIRTDENEIVIEDLVRSAIASHTDIMLEQLQVLSSLLGIELKVSDRYAGWAYSETSQMRDYLEEAVAEHGGILMKKASHGGLECGIFKGLEPEMDIITFGPIAQNAHTPQERLDLASFDRSYDILCDVLKKCR